MDDTTNPNPEPETPHGQRPRAADVLREWGFDLTAFQVRAKQSMDAARGDMSEITGTLRQALASTKQVLVDLERTKRPVASELKTGFERAWDEIENAFGVALSQANSGAASPDDAMLVERQGGRVVIHSTSPDNVKVTTPFDRTTPGVEMIQCAKPQISAACRPRSAVRSGNHLLRSIDRFVELDG